MIVAVLRNRLTSLTDEDYGPLAAHLSELASTMPGHISHKGFVSDDGERITIVQFESEDALQKWKTHPEHTKAKMLGYKRFYSEFSYQICRVIDARAWKRSSSTES